MFKFWHKKEGDIILTGTEKYSGGSCYFLDKNKFQYGTDFTRNIIKTGFEEEYKISLVKFLVKSL